MRPSAALRDKLPKEFNDLPNGDDLALWAYRRITKTVTSIDACAVESAYGGLGGTGRRYQGPSEATGPWPERGLHGNEPQPATRSAQRIGCG
jgi:hypothetical protein